MSKQNYEDRLYAGRVPRQTQSTKVPMAMVEIVVMSMDYRITGSTNEIVRFARAVEAAHGIKPKDVGL